ncbi:EthD family reductase [Luteimicrobium sp. DT211]|uniref:EthD family reductase n=1 Tax=Luteimicrobium sp. DT211 TaxID=3393412 RepID=UPI003CF157D3
MATDAAPPQARFVVTYDTPSDVEAFERHYREVHIPLVKQQPGLRRMTLSHRPTGVIGPAPYLVVMMDWDDLASLQADLESAAGQRTVDDATTNLARYATFRGITMELADA